VQLGGHAAGGEKRKRGCRGRQPPAIETYKTWMISVGGHAAGGEKRKWRCRGRQPPAIETYKTFIKLHKKTFPTLNLN